MPVALPEFRHILDLENGPHGWGRNLGKAVVSGREDFENRMKRLVAKHTAMSRGYTARLRPDGLIVAEPCRPPSPVRGRSLLVVLLAFLMFKGILIASLGGPSYDARVHELWGGNVAEKAGAVIMFPDPVSRMVSAAIGPFGR